MKRNVIYLIMGHLLLMMSCTDEILRKGDISEEVQNAERRSAGDGKLDLLGYGYDATKAFANPNSARAKVIDVDRIKREAPGRIEEGIIGIQKNSITSGSNYTEYNKNVSVKVNATAKFLLFSTTLSSSFSQEELSSSLHSYASVDLKVQRRKLTIYMNEDELCTKYLTSTFTQDCHMLSAEQLVNRYGTHVLRDIVLGGKLSVFYRSQANSSSKKKTVEAGISAGISKIFNIQVDGGYSSSEVSKNSDESLRYYTIGGDPANALVGKVGPKENVVIDITPWQKSVTLQNAQLIDINEDGLIPLYNLIPDSRKKNEVKDYIFSRIYGLIRNRDYLLNGDFYNYIFNPIHPGFPTLTRIVYQIDEGLITVLDRDYSGQGDIIFNSDSVIRSAYPPRQGADYDMFETYVQNIRKYTTDLDQYSPYPISTRKAKDRPILVQEIPSGKFFVQLDQRVKSLRPLYSSQTIDIYHLNRKLVKKIQSTNGYQIGKILI